MVTVLLGTAGLVQRAWNQADVDGDFVVDPRTVEVLGTPDWMAPGLAAELAVGMASAATRRANLLDGGSLRPWAEGLAGSSPWVESLVAVEPRFPGQVELRLTVARPAVVFPDGRYVAADGRVLGPGDARLHPAPLQLIPRSHQAWDGEGLAECAAAAVDLAPFRQALVREELAVSRVGLDGAGLVYFLTDGGVVLEWGRSSRNRAHVATDLSPGQRVASLMELASRRPGLFGVERVVLWKDRPEQYLRP